MQSEHVKTPLYTDELSNALHTTAVARVAASEKGRRHYQAIKTHSTGHDSHVLIEGKHALHAPRRALRHSPPIILCRHYHHPHPLEPPLMLSVLRRAEPLALAARMARPRSVSQGWGGLIKAGNKDQVKVIEKFPPTFLG